MRAVSLLVLAVTFSSDLPAFANDSVYDMRPLTTERLPQPINLKGHCGNVQVVEWRSTPGYEDSTSVSYESKEILNEICNLAVLNFRKFLLKYNYVVNIDNDFHQSISLMPFDNYKYGLNSRNLNDYIYRFSKRYKEYDEFGKVFLIWGYHSRSYEHIFIRNDVLTEEADAPNFRFKTVYAHELFHALSWQYKIFHQHKGNKQYVDEIMARKFTRFLNFGE